MSPTVMLSRRIGFGKTSRARKFPSVLLPVDEVVGRVDPQRVGLDGRARVGRRAQPHDVRIHLNQPVKGVAGAVLQRDLDTHNR